MGSVTENVAMKSAVLQEGPTSAFAYSHSTDAPHLGLSFPRWRVREAAPVGTISKPRSSVKALPLIYHIIVPLVGQGKLPLGLASTVILGAESRRTMTIICFLTTIVPRANTEVNDIRARSVGFFYRRIVCFSYAATWKFSVETVMAYFMELSQHSPGSTGVLPLEKAAIAFAVKGLRSTS
jgi:hypothetical protein